MTVLDRFRLDGKTAIVTGGNRGIGRSIAQALAEAGADVVIANRNVQMGEEAAAEIADDTGTETMVVETNVAEEESVISMVDAVIERFGTIDILVNNAGIVVHEAAETMSVDQWDRVIDINLRGTFLCPKYAGIEMMKAGGGSILSVSSSRHSSRITLNDRSRTTPRRAVSNHSPDNWRPNGPNTTFASIPSLRGIFAPITPTRLTLSTPISIKLGGTKC